MMVRRSVGVLVLAATLSLLLACAATAATRYAAPGGTGKDPCANPTRPCSVVTAAAENARGTTIAAGDVVELAPGIYFAKEEGEFGYVPPVSLPEGVTLRGEPGKPRPVIVIPPKETIDGAFYVPTGSEVADVEIRNRSGHGGAIDVSGGTVDRVIARSMGAPEPTCNFLTGVIRNSACLNSGGGAAVGANIAAKGTYAGVIRNSTLIATGPGSVGMEFIFHAFKRGMTVDIDALGVLVGGEERDVVVDALALNKGRGADVGIELRASSYATVRAAAEDGGTASITPPGAGGNVKALPLLATGNLHQLPGSPTIDRGALDAASGSLDVDGQPRTIGAAPDIGADELGPPSPLLNPAPNTVLGKHPRRRTWKRMTVLAFGSSELGSRYECRFDRSPFRACTSPFKRKVELGKHRFEVRATDPQGQVDRTPAVFRWRVLPLRTFLPDQD